ncbi:MAG: hypothetical protein PVI43_02080 [Candidatus Bathyarchaeota archaeon]|jgi:hypothetical protein
MNQKKRKIENQPENNIFQFLDEETKEFLPEFVSRIKIKLCNNEIVMNIGKSKIAINQEWDIFLESHGKLNFMVDGDLTISANNININAKAETKVEAGTALTASGGTNTTLKGLKVSIKGITDFGMPE